MESPEQAQAVAVAAATAAAAAGQMSTFCSPPAQNTDAATGLPGELCMPMESSGINLTDVLNMVGFSDPNVPPVESIEDLLDLYTQD